MNGFTGSVPQGFIDGSLRVCPLCGGNNPRWTIDQKMQMKMEGNLYLFRCEQCGGILSSPIADVAGFNRTALTTTGLLKKLSGKRNDTIYLRIHSVGTNSDMAESAGKEFTLQELNAMAQSKTVGAEGETKYY